MAKMSDSELRATLISKAAYFKFVIPEDSKLGEYSPRLLVFSKKNAGRSKSETS